jgi:hypothetical protein
MPEQGPLLHLGADHGNYQTNPDKGKLAVFKSRRNMNHDSRST